jgi:putative DNA primase/helicase
MSWLCRDRRRGRCERRRDRRGARRRATRRPRVALPVPIALVIRDGDSGCVLATCWGGCDRRDVLAELRGRGLLDGRADYPPQIISAPRGHDDASRTVRALNIWRSARDGADTMVRRYLASRGIELDPWPPSLRFHARCPRPRNDAGNFLSPALAMAALVEHVEHGPVAVHCTYLRSDGTGKADVEKPKAIFGSVPGGAVRAHCRRAVACRGPACARGKAV